MIPLSELGLPPVASSYLSPGLGEVFHLPELEFVRKPEIEALVERGAPDDIGFFADAVTLLVRMVEIDPTLQHALENVVPKGIRFASSDSRALERELCERFRRWSAAPVGRPDALRALVELDEAIHSIVHLPPPVRGSWWNRFREECRKRLFKPFQQPAEGVEARVRVLPDQLSAALELTERKNVPVTVGGRTGEVLVCLRVWAEIDGSVIKGRALYRV